MTLAPLPKRYDTKVSPIAVPSNSSKPVEKSSNLLPILIIAGVGLFLMKS